MLTSISPLGESGRGQCWGVTMVWLFVGHVVGGLLLGAAMAAGSAGLEAAFGGDEADPWRLAAVLAVVAGAAAFDLAGARVPGRRQVDETWLTSFRGWVYGLGFGAQLGFGLVTVVNTAMLAVVVVAGVLSGPPAALAIGLIHGLTRAVIGSLNGRVRSVDQLKRLHRRLDRAATAVRLAAPSALVVLVGSMLVVGAA